MAERIAVLGTGRMGAGLARLCARSGHSVFVGSRSRERAAETADEIRAQYPDASVDSGDYAAAARAGDMVILAVPFREGAGVLTELRAALAGKVVIDITNPFGAVPPDSSGPQTHARLLPPGAALVAAWKSTFWKLLTPEARAGVVHDVFLCGDDEDAKQRVAALVRDTSFRPLDCGGLANGRILDDLVPLLIELDDRYGHDYTSAWQLLP